MSISFEGRLSVRLGAALNLATEFARATAKYSKGGFHPQAGWIPETRELSPAEQRASDGAIAFLTAGFSRVFETVENKTQARDFCHWMAAANNYIGFCIACTQDYAEPDPDDPNHGYGAELPPKILPRVLSAAELECYEAALAFVVRGWQIKVPEHMVCVLMGARSDDEEDEDDG